MSKITIFCIILGDNRAFSVDIEETKTVDHLKDEIKMKRKHDLVGCDAVWLELYQLKGINFDAPYLEKVRKISQDLGGQESPKLDLWLELSTIKGGFPKGMLHILVEPPAGPGRPTTPPNRSQPEIPFTPEQAVRRLSVSGAPPIQTSPVYPEVDGVAIRPTVEAVKALIYDYTNSLHPKIHDFLAKPRPSAWLPPAVDERTQQFFSNLKIPCVNGKPCLLLHDLGSSIASNLFEGSDHQVLCNTSGSGKTRLLFEELCQRWGFYFVAAQGRDGIGARDLQAAIELMSISSGWIDNLFPHGHQPTPAANNERIAENWISKALLARWAVFDTFIKVTKSIKGEVLDDNDRRDWLIFQTLPMVQHRDMDTFSALIYQCLHGVSTEVLRILQNSYSPSVVLGSAFNPTDSFLYVLDEAQVAGQQYMGAFADEGGTIPRPVLRPIIKCFSTPTFAKVIVSGTGFPLGLCKYSLPSGVGKDNEDWDVVRPTGDFYLRETQLDYISRHLPPSFLCSSSGIHLKTRMYDWLRGRHRFTARFLEELMRGPWNQAGPAAPHKLLNAYIHSYTGVTARDGFQTDLENEPDVGPLKIATFQWEKIKNSPGLLKRLAQEMHNFVTRGDRPMWPSAIEPLVEYGVGRFVSARSTRVSVEEPLALIGILRYLEDNFHTLEGNVTMSLRSDNQGVALERTVLLALTKLLQNQGALKEIFAFHGQSPPWADQPAQIVARNSSGKFEAFSIVTPTTPSSIVAFSAKTPEDVTYWLTSSNKGWCIPCSAMGPDLITRVRLNDGKLLVLVIQAKCYTAGNVDTIEPGVAAGAIKSLDPSNYFRTLRDMKPPRKNQVRQQEVVRSISAMLEAINLGDQLFTGGHYNLLRVVVAHPLSANLNSQSFVLMNELSKVNLPLARLLPEVFTTELATCNDGRALVDYFRGILKRAREEDEEGGAGPSTKKRKVTGV